MAAEKAPAFQFYPNDFLMDGNVAGMSLQERGAYITLLCICWKERSLPNDPVRLARMLGVPAPVFRKLWPALKKCFTNGRELTHKRLDIERAKQDAYRNSQRERGLKGGRPKATGLPDETHGLAESNPDESSSIFNLQTAVNKNPLTPFQGARVTRADKKLAKEIRRNRFGRCHHEPPCEDGLTCEAVIASELAAKRAS